MILPSAPKHGENVGRSVMSTATMNNGTVVEQQHAENAGAGNMGQ